MIEQELKLTAPNAATLAQVLQCSAVNDAALAYHDGEPDTFEPVAFSAVYYDTQDLILDKIQCSLRARMEGASFKAALKMKGQLVDGLSQREEFEENITGWLNTPEDIPAGVLRDRLAEFIADDAALVQRVTITMQRRLRMLNYADSNIELVADEALIKGKKNQATLFEIELELKQGKVGAIIELGRYLQTQFNLIPSTRSKYSIGLSLG